MLLVSLSTLSIEAQVPVLHYPLDGDATDIAGAANSAVVFGAVAGVDRFGSIEGAMFFDGIDDYIEAPSDFDMPVRSINFWFQAETISNSTGMPFNIDHAGLNYGNAMMRVVSVGGQGVLRYNGGAGGVATSHEEPIVAGQWYMATIVMSEDSLWYYLDCELVGEALNFNGSSTSGVDKLVIGTDRDYTPFYHGLIDDFKIFDVALQADEVCALFEAEAVCDLSLEVEATEACFGDEWAFLGQGSSPSGDILSYSWTIDGVSATDGLALEYNFSSAGNYEVICLLEGANQMCSVADTSLISIAVPEPVLILGPNNSCGEETVELILDTAVDSLLWSNGERSETLLLDLVSDTLIEVQIFIGGCPSSATFEIELSELPPVEIEASPLVCAGSTTVLTVDAAGGEVLWSTGETSSDIEVLISEATTVLCTITSAGCSQTDSVTIEAIGLPSYEISGMEEVCTGAMESYFLEQQYDSLLWSGGSRDDTLAIEFTQSTLLEASVYAQGCVSEAELLINVQDLPIVSIVGPTEVCQAGLVQLEANGASSYLWSTGDFTQVIDLEILGDTTVYVDGVNLCGVDTDSLSVVIASSELEILPDVNWTTASYSGELLNLIVPYDFTVYLDGEVYCVNCQAIELNLSEDEHYLVVYRNGVGCSAEFDVNVGVIQCPPLFIPNAFTPNQDGVNDFFSIVADENCYSDIDMSIYDRWGGEICHIDEKVKFWDGGPQEEKGYFQNDEVYTYVIEYSLGKSSNRKKQVGYVTVLR